MRLAWWGKRADIQILPDGKVSMLDGTEEYDENV